MNSGGRCVAGALCATIFLSALGCVSGVERAEQERRFLYPGMSMDEVAAQLGEPAQVIKGDPGSETVWIYRFEGGPTVAATIALAVLFVALIVVVAMSKSGGGSFGGGGGGDGPPSQIRLRFGPDGRLFDVSPPHPVSGP